MALDWFVLDKNAPFDKSRRASRMRREFVLKDPGCHFGMEENVHAALMAHCGHLPCLRRAIDYYQDATYAPHEMEQLLGEINTYEDPSSIRALLDLCHEALRRNAGIVAFAD